MYIYIDALQDRGDQWSEAPGCHMYIYVYIYIYIYCTGLRPDRRGKFEAAKHVSSMSL